MGLTKGFVSVSLERSVLVSLAIIEFTFIAAEVKNMLILLIVIPIWPLEEHKKRGSWQFPLCSSEASLGGLVGKKMIISLEMILMSPCFSWNQLTKEMVMEKPSAQLVGREFVRQYYTLLNQAPDYLHRSVFAAYRFRFPLLDASEVCRKWDLKSLACLKCGSTYCSAAKHFFCLSGFMARTRLMYMVVWTIMANQLKQSMGSLWVLIRVL